MRTALTLFIFLITHEVSFAFEERCGSCWCAPEDGLTEDNCPNYGEGISDSFSKTVSEGYKALTLTSDPITLVSEDGEECFPFQEALGSSFSNGEYAESTRPQCAKPASLGTETVCAYKIVNCSSYTMESYESEAAAVADGAVVAHSGPCGVCSNAFDFGVRMNPDIDLRDIGIRCGFTYSLSLGNFASAVDCYKKEAGFSDACTELWAHFVATNSYKCALQCNPGADGVKLNNDPPTCDYAECITCNLQYQADFDDLSGRTLVNSGITESIARPCSEFTEVRHDLLHAECFETDDAEEATTSAPTAAPAPTSGSATVGAAFVNFLWILLALSKGKI